MRPSSPSVRTADTMMDALQTLPFQSHCCLFDCNTILNHCVRLHSLGMCNTVSASPCPVLLCCSCLSSSVSQVRYTHTSFSSLSPVASLAFLLQPFSPMPVSTSMNIECIAFVCSISCTSMCLCSGRQTAYCIMDISFLRMVWLTSSFPFLCMNPCLYFPFFNPLS